MPEDRVVDFTSNGGFVALFACPDCNRVCASSITVRGQFTPQQLKTTPFYIHCACGFESQLYTEQALETRTIDGLREIYLLDHKSS